MDVVQYNQDNREFEVGVLKTDQMEREGESQESQLNMLWLFPRILFSLCVVMVTALWLLCCS